MFGIDLLWINGDCEENRKNISNTLKRKYASGEIKHPTDAIQKTLKKKYASGERRKDYEERVYITCCICGKKVKLRRSIAEAKGKKYACSLSCANKRDGASSRLHNDVVVAKIKLAKAKSRQAGHHNTKWIPRIQFSCTNCGKLKEIREDTKDKRHFCCPECQGEWSAKHLTKEKVYNYKERIKTYCDVCGEPVFKMLSEIKTRKYITCGSKNCLKQIGYLQAMSSKFWEKSTFCKPYFVSELGHGVRSSLEEEGLLILKRRGVNYAYEKPFLLKIGRLQYFYHPDATLDHQDCIEFKGYPYKGSMLKCKVFRDQYPLKRLIMVTYSVFVDRIKKEFPDSYDDLITIEQLKEFAEINLIKQEE